MRRLQLPSPSPLLLLSLAVLGPVASAAEPGAPLETVIVTASREPEPQFEALAASVVIDRDTIERSPGGDVGDLLRFNAWSSTRSLPTRILKMRKLICASPRSIARMASLTWPWRT